MMTLAPHGMSTSTHVAFTPGITEEFHVVDWLHKDQPARGGGAGGKVDDRQVGWMGVWEVVVPCR